MKNKFRILIVCITLISSCKRSSVDLEGFWVSEERNDVLLFRNDTLHSKVQYPMPYIIDGNNIITSDTFSDLASKQIPFKFKDNILSIPLYNDYGGGRVIVEFKKSQFDNIFDHEINKLGIQLDLQNGFSNSRLRRKTYYDFVHVGLAKDSSITIVLNDKKVSLSYLSESFKKSYYSNYYHTNCAIAVDKNILFSDYIEIHRSITEQDSNYIRLEHAVRRRPFHWLGDSPWEQVSYDRVNMVFASQLPQLENKKYDFITFEVDTSGSFLLNGIIVNDQSFYKRVVDLYSLSTKNRCFATIKSDNLTYGNYLWFSSLKNKIVLEKRDKYCMEEYNKNWEELQYYDMGVAGSEKLRDSLTRHVKQMIPNRSIIQDL